MSGASVFPYDLDMFDDSENFRTKFRKFFANVDKLGKYVTSLLARLIAEQEAFNALIDDAEERDEPFEDVATTFLSDTSLQLHLTSIYDAWCEALVTEMEGMREIRHYSLSEEHFGLGANGKPQVFKNTNGAHVFFELTRVNYLVHYPQLLSEMENLSLYDESDLTTTHYFMLHSLKMTKHKSWVAIVDSFDISSLYDEKEAPDEEVEEMRANIKALWDKPIMQYTQSQVQMIVFFLTQQLNDVPTSEGGKVVEEYRRVFLVVWLRIAQFFIEFQPATTLDCETLRKGPFDTGDATDINTCSVNQQFVGFCFFYMGELLRRFFYYDHLVKNSMREVPQNVEKLTQSTKTWVSRICESLAEDAFDDLYTNGLPIAYAFVGDDGYFKFSKAAVHSRGACIAEFRAHLHRRYFSEAQVTRRSVLSSTNESYVSRLFVLRLIDAHLRIHLTRVRWLNAVLVMNDDIELSAYKLETNLVPVIIQVFSSFWAYDRGRVYICDDIYETVAVWFWLLATRYKGVLYDCDLTHFVRQVIPLEEQSLPPINVAANEPSFLDMTHFEF